MCPPSLVKISAMCLKTEKIKKLTRDTVSAEENWNVNCRISRWHRVDNTTEIHHKIPQTQWSYTTLPYNKQHFEKYGCLLKLSAKGLRQIPRHLKKQRFQPGPNFHPIFIIQTTIFSEKVLDLQWYYIYSQCCKHFMPLYALDNF